MSIVAVDRELHLMLCLSRRLPRSLKFVAKKMRKVYLRRPCPSLVSDVLGCQMELDPADWVDARILFYPHLYDRAEVSFLRRWLQPGDTFLDAGSNVGFYSLMASRSVGPAGRVLAVEAAPATAIRLRRNIGLNGYTNIQVVEAGISDRNEMLRLGINTSGNQGANSFLMTGSPAGIDVRCMPLAELLQEAGITRLDAAKFDIEGFEHRVLSRFFADADRARYPSLIQVETNWTHFAENTKNTLRLLDTIGYKLRLRTKGNRILELSECGRPAFTSAG